MGVFLLKQLTYASRAMHDLNSEDLSSIVASSVRNNTLYGLTGALCYANGTFIQYFEGDHLAVSRLYRHLLKDVRHSDLTILSVYEVAKRRFPTWSMGFFSYESEIGQIFLKHSKMAKVSPFSMIASDANEFFNEVVKYISNE